MQAWNPVAEIPFYSLPDIVALIVVLLCAFIGWRRGLSGELARLATVLLALLIAVRLREPLASLIRAWTSLDSPVDSALAFTLLSIAGLILLSLVCRLLKRIMQVTFTPGLERGGGLAAGTLRGIAVVVIVFIMFNLWPHDGLNRVFGQASLVGRAVQRMLPALRDRWDELLPRRPVVQDQETTDHH